MVDNETTTSSHAMSTNGNGNGGFRKWVIGALFTVLIVILGRALVDRAIQAQTINELRERVARLEARMTHVEEAAQK